MKLSKTAKWAIGTTIAAATLVATLVALLPRNDGDQVTGVTASVGGPACVGVQGDCTINPPPSPPATQPPSVASATQPPSGSGPWIFEVRGTGTDGLYVRDGYLIDDHHLTGSPTLAEGAKVYVDCQVRDGWVADPSVSTVGVWYKIRYPEVSQEGDFWVYGGFLAPLMQNGDVPVCQTP